MNFNKFYTAIVLIIISGNLTLAADSGSNGLAFLKVDVGARAAAMGGAFTAIANDATAAYYNSAGLAASEKNNLMLTHHAGIVDITQDFAAVKFRAGSHHLAFSVNVYNIPGIEIRDEQPTEDPDGVVNALSFYTAFGYARALDNHWQIGLNVKYLFEKLYLNSASGWAIDFGIRRTEIINGLDWGISLQNLGKMKQLKDRATPLPLLVRSGFAYTIPYQLLGNNPLLAADMEYIKDGASTVRIGTEIPLLRSLAIRFGYRFGSGYSQWSTGLGLNYRRFYFNYAFAPSSYDLETSHRLTLGLFF